MKQLSTQLITFGVIGLINTAVDTGIYALLLSAGITIWVAIFCSTSLGLLTSFILNRRFTFGREHAMSAQLLTKFLVVTLAGLWILQPLIVSGLRHGFGVSSILALTVFKLAATVVTLIWNFIWYRLYVFTAPRQLTQKL